MSNISSIVKVTVTDNTSAISQAGFNSALIVDFNQAKSIALVEDATGLTGSLGEAVSAYLANGGSEVYIAGSIFNGAEDKDAVKAYLDTLDEHDFYGVIPILGVGNEKECADGVAEFVAGTERLAVIELNGTVATVTGIADWNSDRVAVFANSDSEYGAINAAVGGMGFPATVGSITWGNKNISEVQDSGYSSSDEALLKASYINYITTEMGLTLTQFGRTTSGSNLDTTRGKDWLSNRVKENITALLVNSKKVPFTDKGLASVSATLAEVGEQAITQDLATDYLTSVPDYDDIPKNDIANRVLNNVVLTVKMATPIETMNIEVSIEL